MTSHAATDFPGGQAPLKLPDSLPGEGVLVGWSLERNHRRQPIGFSFGVQQPRAAGNVVDPILLEGEGHLITVAPTGAGKGVGCIVPALLRYPGSVIVVDPKGENAAITARRRREMGHEVVVLDPMGLTGLEAARFNPLDLIDPESPTGVDDAHTLVNQLLRASGSSKDLFWESRARQLLVGVVLYVLTDLPKSEHTLARVRTLVNEAAGSPQAVMHMLSGSRHPEARATADLMSIGAAETLGGIVAFAQEGVDFIRGPLIAEATGESTFSLDDVIRGDPLSIFIVLPPHMLISHGRLLRLWVGTLMTAIMRRRARPARSTLFVLDEAAQLGPFDELRKAVTLLRGYGLQTWSFWQDVSQLQLLYPNDWRTMVNNSKVVQCFGANTMLAASDMAAIVGAGSGGFVLDLEADEMLLQIAGDEAVVAKLPNYRTDPAFQGMFDENPYYDADRDPVGPPRTPLTEYIRPARPAPRARFEAPVPADVALSGRIVQWLETGHDPGPDSR